jgi:hypothetical protein
MTRSTGTAQRDLAARFWPGRAARIARAGAGRRLIPALLLLAITLALAPLVAAQPSRPDGDGDGLVDVDETGIYRTDPFAADTDGDNLVDDDEVNVYGTSPDNSDTDEDGRPDGPEVAEGTDPLVKTMTTLHISGAPGPAPVDSDGDGLDDGAEATYGTDPTRIDTDNDGLKDGEEVTTFGTSPTTWDTDGNGYNDWEDAAASLQLGCGRALGVSRLRRNEQQACQQGKDEDQGEPPAHPSVLHVRVEQSRSPSATVMRADA